MYQILPRNRVNIQKEVRTKNNDRSKHCWHLYPSFPVWRVLKYSNREVGRDTTQPHEFKCWMPGMPMVSVFPAATNLYFPYGSLNGKWKSVCALLSHPPPPWGEQRSKVKEILIPLQSTPRAPKHKPNSSHHAWALANLCSLPQRSTSILNGNYYTLTHIHAQCMVCTDEMQKTKRRKGGVQGETEKKMRCSEKKRRWNIAK